MADPLSRADAVLGDTLERAVTAHHHRRLTRIGRAEALVPASPGLWATTATTPPREGNALEVLVDGAQGLPAMAEAIRGAQRHVHVCSWHLEADFAPERDGARRSRVRELLGEAAERVPVRVLVWAGAPVPVFKPSRNAVRAQRDALVRGTRIRVELDAHGRAMHCHHEKIVIVDDEVAFVGG